MQHEDSSGSGSAGRSELTYLEDERTRVLARTDELKARLTELEQQLQESEQEVQPGVDGNEPRLRTIRLMVTLCESEYVETLAGGDGARPAAGRDAGRARPDRGRDGRRQSAAAQAGGAGERHPEGEGQGTHSRNLSCLDFQLMGWFGKEKKSSSLFLLLQSLSSFCIGIWSIWSVFLLHALIGSAHQKVRDGPYFDPLDWMKFKTSGF